MFPLNLTTNEVKDSAGTEIEFLRQSVLGRKLVFAKSGESPNLPYRLGVSHEELGTGLKLRRRSQLWVKKTFLAADGLTPVTELAYTVSDSPVGAVAANTEHKNVLANLMSLLASQGATTTILFDCTGYGAAALLDGSM